MKALSWLKYFGYLLLIVGVIWAKGFAETAFQTDYSTTMKFNYLLFTLMSLVAVIIGVVLGLESFLLETKKEGKWKINLPKIILIILPCLCLSSFYFIAMINNNTLYKYILYPVFSFFGKSDAFISIFQIILGYSIITVMYKKAVKTEAAVENNESMENYESVENQDFADGNETPEDTMTMEDSVDDTEEVSEAIEEKEPEEADKTIE